MSMADSGVGGEESVVTFDGIAMLTPRGRYNVELHLSFMRLQGKDNDFKIQYSNVVRISSLPKHNEPHTLVAITLDPPIRTGQTSYQHIVLQFETDNVVNLSLTLSEDLLNTEYKEMLLRSYQGLIHDIFTQILCGLSGSKVTEPEKFSSSQDGYAVKSSLQTEDGLLYPLEKSFFFLPKPPTLILHEEIDYVEFERHAAGTANIHYFDLLIRLKTEQEHLFRNIQRNEYHNLFDFISGQGLKIMNLNEAQATEGVPILLDDDDDAVDSHLERIKNEAGGDGSDEEGEDFVLNKDDNGSPTDDSGGDEFDGSGSGGEEKKADDDGSKKKKQKKKMDPNAPKRASSAFMYFSQSERENVKKSNPGITFTDVGKVLGERWNKLSAEEKEPFEAMAKADKKRYSEQVRFYKNPQPTAMDDVVLNNDDGGSSTDDFGGDESDASGSSGGEEEKPAKKKPKKEATVSNPYTSKKKADDDGSKKKKQKYKKDPNAPKRAISAFMYFCQSERENVKKSNPGIAFTDVGKILGERWNNLSAEEKEPFEAMAKADKKRYSEQISDYKNPQLTAMDSGSESESS